MNELTKLTPEHYSIAEAYLQYGTVEETAEQLGLPQYQITEALQKPETQRFLDGIYLDQGYRNRSKLGRLLDKVIESKLEEAEETGIYSSKDLFDLIQLAHKIQLENAKLQKDPEDTSTTVQIANFGTGNYGNLMERLLNGKKGT